MTPRITIHRSFNPPSAPQPGLLRRYADDHASQIVELALSLPLLVLFAIGIFDFSGALALKQKLTNAAREGARVAAADPASDLYVTSGVPVSVSDALQVIENYLASEKINPCGLPGSVAQSQLTWTYQSNAGCPGTGITLAINRGCLTLENGVYLAGTCVTISYAYKWQYSSAPGLLGLTFIGPSTITTTATAFNEN